MKNETDPTVVALPNFLCAGLIQGSTRVFLVYHVHGTTDETRFQPDDSAIAGHTNCISFGCDGSVCQAGCWDDAPQPDLVLKLIQDGSWHGAAKWDAMSSSAPTWECDTIPQILVWAQFPPQDSSLAEIQQRFLMEPLPVRSILLFHSISHHSLPVRAQRRALCSLQSRNSATKWH